VEKSSVTCVIYKKLPKVSNYPIDEKNRPIWSPWGQLNRGGGGKFHPEESVEKKAAAFSRIFSVTVEKNGVCIFPNFFFVTVRIKHFLL
jgi:hypothetical protein